MYRRNMRKTQGAWGRTMYGGAYDGFKREERHTRRKAALERSRECGNQKTPKKKTIRWIPKISKSSPSKEIK